MAAPGALLTGGVGIIGGNAMIGIIGGGGIPFGDASGAGRPLGSFGCLLALRLLDPIRGNPIPPMSGILL